MYRSLTVFPPFLPYKCRNLVLLSVWHSASSRHLKIFGQNSLSEACPALLLGRLLKHKFLAQELLPRVAWDPRKGTTNTPALEDR